MTRFFLGITGASGTVYARTLFRGLLFAGCDVDVALSGAGERVMKHEFGDDPGPGGRDLAGVLARWAEDAPDGAGAFRAFPSDDIGAPPSSGTALTGGVVLCPCSMGTLARVSVGFSSNLVERAADVALKEGRTLLIVPRETPLSEVHLENLLRLSRLGATILPAMPGFYHHPRTLDDLVEHVVGKVLDRLGVEHGLGARWKGLAQEEDPGIESPRSTPGPTPGSASGAGS